MKTITIRQLQAGPLVLMPRTRLQPVKAQHVDRAAFRAVQLTQPDGQAVWTLEQTAAPRMIFQVWQTATPAELDEVLGRLLGIHELPSYCTTSDTAAVVVLFAGNRDHMEINQRNHRQVYSHINTVKEQAAAWCGLYGGDLL